MAENSQLVGGNMLLTDLECRLAAVDFVETISQYKKSIVPHLRWSEPPSPSKSLVPYLHPNGFVLIPLPQSVIRRDSSYRFRLHIWPAGEGVPEDAHSHAWSFASRVIGGAISYELYNECSLDESNIHRRRFTFQLGSAGLDSIGDIPLVGLRPLTCGVMKRNSYYALRGDVIHATRQVISSGACTMVCIGPNERNQSVVYIDESKRSSIVRVEKVPLTPVELNVALETALDLAQRS